MGNLGCAALMIRDQLALLTLSFGGILRWVKGLDIDITAMSRWLVRSVCWWLWAWTGASLKLRLFLKSEDKVTQLTFGFHIHVAAKRWLQLMPSVCPICSPDHRVIAKKKKPQKLNVLVGGYVCLKTWNGGTRTVFPPSTVKIFLLQTWLLEAASSVLKWISFPEENMQEIRRWTRVLPPQMTVTVTHLPPATPSLPRCHHQLTTLHRTGTPVLLYSWISSMRYSDGIDLEKIDV